MHKINHANIKEWAANYKGELFDGILCDPPYEIGFMSREWDSSGIAFDTEMWADILKLLKPGGHLLAFSGSRTYHRMAVAIEDAGFEIRDQLIYIYGSGFPKALNINKQLNTCNCSGNAVPYNHDKQSTEHDLRPMPDTDISQTNRTATEQGQVLQSGVSEQSTHGSVQGQEPSKGLETREEPSVEGRKLHRATEGLQNDTDARTPQSEAERLRARTHSGDGTDNRQTTTGRGRSTSPEQAESGQSTRELETIRESYYTLDGESLPRCSRCQSPILQGEYKTALKPAHEPCVLARKPIEGTVANNVLKHGTGGLAIDATRIPTTENRSRDNSKCKPDPFFSGKQRINQVIDNSGRFPANLIHDGSDEVEAVFPQTNKSKAFTAPMADITGGNFKTYKGNTTKQTTRGHNDNGGSASRYFYTAKSSRRERNAGLDTPNTHPTLKPLSLTKYLATLIKPPTGGRLLVPFSGSGSEVIGGLLAGWSYVEGVELTQEYIPISEARIKYWTNISHTSSKPKVSAKNNGEIQNQPESLTLF